MIAIMFDEQATFGEHNIGIIISIISPFLLPFIQFSRCYYFRKPKVGFPIIGALYVVHLCLTGWLHSEFTNAEIMK